MTVSPTTWFSENASAIILFCNMKDVFIEEKSAEVGNSLPHLKLLRCNKAKVVMVAKKAEHQRYKGKMSVLYYNWDLSSFCAV